MTAASTTIVVMVVAELSPHPWEPPILRLADTLVGVAVGIAAAGLAFRLHGRTRSQPGHDT